MSVYIELFVLAARSYLRRVWLRERTCVQLSMADVELEIMFQVEGAGCLHNVD